MNKPFSAIVIIFNPNSTGSAPQEAEALFEWLKQTYKELPVELYPTEAPKHATEITEKVSREHRNLLVISVSGDGGYHEVINGAMQLEPEARPICTVCPAGNANDHSRAIHKGEFQAILQKGKIINLDLLCAEVKRDGKSIIEYAHSYIGLGITPVVAIELNRTSLNALREAWIVLKTFWSYQPFKIIKKNKEIELNSLVYTNIPYMAKILTISEEARPDDGELDVILIPNLSKWRLLKLAFRAIFKSLRSEQVSSSELEIISDMPMQLDGEVMELKKGDKIRVTVARSALKTLV